MGLQILDADTSVGTATTTPVEVLTVRMRRTHLMVQVTGSVALWYYWGSSPGDARAWFQIQPGAVIIPGIQSTLYVRSASATVDYSILGLREVFK